MPDSPEAPARLRPPLPAEELQRRFNAVAPSAHDFARRWRVDDRRLRRWLAGEEPAPVWFENVLVVLFAAVTVKGIVETLEPKPRLAEIELGVLGDVLEDYTGSRHDLRDRPKPPSFTCPTCKRISYHPKDVEERFCAICGFADS